MVATNGFSDIPNLMLGGYWVRYNPPALMAALVEVSDQLTEFAAHQMRFLGTKD
jgi:hypothetical protein